MAIEGSYDWFVARAYSRLPTNWFPDNHPILSTIIGALALAGAYAYSLLSSVKAQGRIKTSSGYMLDISAQDHFGPGNFPRRAGESDPSYSARIIAERFRPLGTKPSMISVLQDTTGLTTHVFEPALNGACDGACFADDPNSLLGSYDMPWEAFIEVQRPPGPGIPASMGFTEHDFADSTLFAADASLYESAIEDAEIMRAVSTTLPAGVKGWTLIYAGQGSRAVATPVTPPQATPGGAGLDFSDVNDSAYLLYY